MHIKNKWSILLIGILIIFISLVIYQKTHITIWGFEIPKEDLKDVIVQTDKHSYLIKDKEMVLKIAVDISNMEKYSKIESFPSQNKPVQYKKVLIQTGGNTTYGGSIWVTENKTILDSNGYYWEFDYKDFCNDLNASLKNATLLN